MEIRFTKLTEGAKAPYRGSEFSAGYDLTAVSRAFDEAHECWIYGTGLALEIPRGYVGLLFPRSSVYKTGQILANCVGVIDSDYRGEVKVIFRKLMAWASFYEIGERICQLLIVPVPQVEYSEVSALSSTERGLGGFGSTGRI